MASLLPDISTDVANRLGFRREVDVPQLLQRTPPAGYEIFHGVYWHALYEGKDCHWEIDFVVMNHSGSLLLVGRPCWTDGQLLVDSVYLFKGQSATAVILTEVDFNALGRHERVLLFVGMTRGLMSVSLVLSLKTAELLAAVMQG